MANTLGSRENPLYFADDNDEVRFQSAQKKMTSYVELDSEGECTELPAETVPTSKSVQNIRKSNTHNSNVALRSSSFPVRKADSAETDSLRTPSIKPKPKPNATIITLSDDEDPAELSRWALRNNQAKPLSGEGTALMPSLRDLHPPVSNARLPDRTKPAEPSTPSLPSPQTVTSPALRNKSLPEGPRSTAPRATRKEQNTSTASVPMRSANQRSKPIATSVTTPSASGCDVPLANRLGNTTDVQHESARELQYPTVHRKESPKANLGLYAQSNKVGQKSSRSPIGGSARSGREQTALGRVEWNATSISPSERVELTDEAQDNATQSNLRESSRKSGASNVLKPTSKPRMVKRAVSPPRQKTFKSPIHRLGREHAASRNSPEASSRDSRSVESLPFSISVSALNEATLGRQVKDSGFSYIADDVASKELSRDEGSSNVNAGFTRMGSQLSAAAVVPDPILTSIEASHCDLETPHIPIPRAKPTPSPAEMQAKVGRQGLLPLVVVPGLKEHLIDQGKLNSRMHVITDDFDAARQSTEIYLNRHLDDQYEDHAYFVKDTMWRQRTCYEREIRARSDGEDHSPIPVLPERYIQTTSPFENMSVIQVPFEKSSGKERPKDVTQEVFTRASPKDTVVRSTWSVPSATYKVESVRIPPFKEYVSLKINILADNESKLLTMPYLGDDGEEEGQEALVQKLPRVYEIRHDINALSDLRNEQCRFYTDSINSFLEDIGITWEMILYWLLASDMELQDVNRSSDGHKNFENVLLDRSAFDKEIFHRDDKMRTAILFVRGPNHLQGLLRQLKKPSAAQLRLTALACSAILARCNISPWYMARQCEIMHAYVQSKITIAHAASKFNFRRIVCRVCHEHNCLFHGQIREIPGSDFDSESEQSDSKEEEEDDEIGEVQSSSQFKAQTHDDDPSTDINTLIPAHVDEDDFDIEKVINYRVPINTEVLTTNPAPDFVASKHAIPPQGPFNAKWWQKHTSTVKWEKRNPFVPCNHAGSCVKANCRCFREGVTCEKTCRCPSSCHRRFPGCNCVSNTLDGKRTCGTEKGCLCFRFKRECDADLCGTCGATEILDPVNRYDEELLHERCTNVGIQRGIPKKTLLGQSEVHGFGLYAGQDIQKDDIIGEYTGEIISVEESERRMVIYEYEKNMYLFKLNKKQEVDATYMGNKLRFINNANKNLTNCYPKVLLCNTIFRVALYASVEIKAGTEFFFHYNYPEETTMHFKQPKGKVVAVKQMKPVTSKPKRATSRSSSYISSEPSSEYPNKRQNEALAKARAAKAAKHAARLAEQGLQATGRVTGLKQARKSATNAPTKSRSSRDSEVRGRYKTAQNFDIPEEVEVPESAMDGNEDVDKPASAKTWEKNEAVKYLVVQDTDEEDEEILPNNTKEGADVHSVSNDTVEVDLDGAGDGGSQAMPRGPDRPRGIAAKSAPVFAVNNKKGKLDDHWLDAGRKRKRPLVVNSDEE